MGRVDAASLLRLGPFPLTGGFAGRKLDYRVRGNEVDVSGRLAGPLVALIASTIPAISSPAIATPFWSPLPDRSVAPAGTWGGALFYDARRLRFVYLQGPDLTCGSSTWALDAGGDHRWTLLAPVGPDLTPARWFTATACDSASDHLYLFGGAVCDHYVPVSDVSLLTLDLAAPGDWTRLAVTGPAPPARYGATLTVDPLRRRLLLFGGFDASRVPRNDVWSVNLDGPSRDWTQLTPGGTPPPARGRHAAVYDPERDRLLVMGGYGPGALGDIWALSLSGTPQWAAVPAVGVAPTGAYSAFYEGTADRVVAGRLSAISGGVWELPLAAGLAWNPVATAGMTPSGGAAISGAWDPHRLQLLVVVPDPWLARDRSSMLQFAPLPPVSVNARLMGADFRAGVTRVRIAMSSDTTLWQPPSVVRTDTVGTFFEGYPGPEGIEFVDKALMPGHRYAYRVRWFDGQTIRETPDLSIDTPPPPVFLDARLDSFRFDTTQRPFRAYLHWTVYSDSAGMLSPVGVERRLNTGDWTPAWRGFPTDRQVLIADAGIDPVFTVYRIAWGDSLQLHGPDQIVSVHPTLFSLHAAPERASLVWVVPPGVLLAATVYRRDSNSATWDVTGQTAADASGALRFVEDTRPSGTFFYRLGWVAGGVEQFTPETPAVATQVLFAPLRAQLTPDSVTTTWRVEPDDEFEPLIQRNVTGTWEPWALLPYRPGFERSYTDRRVAPGTTCMYRLRYGTVTSAEFTVQVPNRLPASAVAVFASLRGVSIDWSLGRPAGFAVRVLRRGPNDGPWSEIGQAFSDDRGHVAVLDEDVRASSRYRYQLAWTEGDLEWRTEAAEAATPRLTAIPIEARATAEAVESAWRIETDDPQGFTAALERRVSDDPVWREITALQAGGEQRHVDTEVIPGTVYAYRLRWTEGTTAVSSASVSAVAPFPPLSLRGPRPNPAPGRARITIALPDRASSVLEVFDLGGRRRMSRTFSGPGVHDVALDVSGLGPGVYLLRLTHPTGHLTRRLVVMR
jgi:hypothetical protein